MNRKHNEDIEKNSDQNKSRHEEEDDETNGQCDLSAEVDRVLVQYPYDQISSEDSKENWTEVWEYDEGFERWLHRLSLQQSRQSDEVIRNQERKSLLAMNTHQSVQDFKDKTYSQSSECRESAHLSPNSKQDSSCKYLQNRKSEISDDSFTFLMRGLKKIENIQFISHSTCARCQRKIEILEIGTLLSLLTSKLTYRVVGHPTFYTCEICQLQLSKKRQLTRHVSWHIFRNEAYCPECRNELKTLTLEPLYSCNTRNNRKSKNFGLRASDRKMLRKDVARIGKPPICKSCGKVFDYFIPLFLKVIEFKSERRSIVKTIHSFICHCCNNDNISKNCLVQHLVDHINLGEIQCRLCQKRRETNGS